MMEWLDTVFTVIAVFSAIYFYVTHKQSYWNQKGVPYVKPTFLLGTVATRFKDLPFKDRLHEIYMELKPQGRIGGYYLFTSPTLMVLDPELLKAILIKDFNYFCDRGFYQNEKGDPLSSNLLSLTGNKWKTLRAKLTPAFTSGRMKMMFPIISDISKELEKTAQIQAQNNSTMEIKDLLARFTTDVIGNCVFGLDCNTLENPDTEFRKYGVMAFQQPSPMAGLKQLFLLIFPRVGRFFNMMFNNPKVAEFFLRIVREIVDYREKSPVVRHDFMNSLISLKNSTNESEKLTFNELAAQVFLFFLAGFETSSTTMMYCLYELALNPDIQTKTREHINHVLQKHKNEVTYEAVMDMTYLDQVINETLRIYPALTVLIRICTQEYKIPGSDVTLPVGSRVNIPVYGLHHDPEYYPNPRKFDPERFTKEEIAKRPPCVFLPFGEGPRICIGQRFGFMQTKVGLVVLLRSLKFSKCQETEIPLKGFPQSLPFLTLKQGIKLGVEKIDSI